MEYTRRVVLEGRAFVAGRTEPYPVRCSELTGGGMYLAGEHFGPPVRTQLKVVITTLAGELACQCEVIRGAGRESGVGVQFLEPSEYLKECMKLLARGLPTPRTSESLEGSWR